MLKKVEYKILRNIKVHNVRVYYTEAWVITNIIYIQCYKKVYYKM